MIYQGSRQSGCAQKESQRAFRHKSRFLEHGLGRGVACGHRGGELAKIGISKRKPGQVVERRSVHRAQGDHEQYSPQCRPEQQLGNEVVAVRDHTRAEGCGEQEGI